MASSGWIWLVMDVGRRLAIVPTYGSGTILARSRQQTLPDYLAPSIERQHLSKRTHGGGSSVSSAPGTPSQRLNAVRSASPLFPATSTSAPPPFDPSGQVRQFGVLNRLRNTVGNPENEDSILFGADGQVASSSPPTSNKQPVHPMTAGSVYHHGDRLTPLFCVSVHEHAWLQDYGVWGKEEYLTRFWDSLHWGRVGHLHYEIAKNL